MPPVAIAVVSSVAGSLVTGAGIGGALFGAGLLGSFGAAIIADTIIGGLIGLGISQIGNRAITPKPKKSGGGGGAEAEAKVTQTCKED